VIGGACVAFELKSGNCQDLFSWPEECGGRPQFFRHAVGVMDVMVVTDVMAVRGVMNVRDAMHGCDGYDECDGCDGCLVFVCVGHNCHGTSLRYSVWHQIN